MKEFANSFKGDFYCDVASIHDAIKRKSIFNIIDHASAYKADFVILKNELYRRTEFERKQQIKFFDRKIYIASVEDLLISKLVWVQDLQSAVQIDDIRNILELENLDRKYINYWVKELNLNTFNLIK